MIKRRRSIYHESGVKFYMGEAQKWKIFDNMGMQFSLIFLRSIGKKVIVFHGKKKMVAL